MRKKTRGSFRRQQGPSFAAHHGRGVSSWRICAFRCSEKSRFQSLNRMLCGSDAARARTLARGLQYKCLRVWVSVCDTYSDHIPAANHRPCSLTFTHETVLQASAGNPLYNPSLDPKFVYGILAQSLKKDPEGPSLCILLGSRYIPAPHALHNALTSPLKSENSPLHHSLTSPSTPKSAQ